EEVRPARGLVDRPDLLVGQAAPLRRSGVRAQSGLAAVDRRGAQEDQFLGPFRDCARGVPDRRGEAGQRVLGPRDECCGV
ncbi:MAG: hypothetical protein AVDCRST_MAG88-4155, partial [uncultured Thermomicrobiales bacterium]